MLSYKAVWSVELSDAADFITAGIIQQIAVLLQGEVTCSERGTQTIMMPASRSHRHHFEFPLFQSSRTTIPFCSFALYNSFCSFSLCCETIFLCYRYHAGIFVKARLHFGANKLMRLFAFFFFSKQIYLMFQKNKENNNLYDISANVLGY